MVSRIWNRGKGMPACCLMRNTRVLKSNSIGKLLPEEIAVLCGESEKMKIYKYPYQTGQEVQILDAAIYDDPDSALGGEIEIENAREDLEARKHFVGALYDLSAPSKDIEVNPANQWNSYHITIDYEENKGEVVLNGKLINSFPLRGPKWEEMVVESKFSKSDAEESVYLGEARWKGFGKYSKGHISFQDHPGLVAFKNIRIRELN